MNSYENPSLSYECDLTAERDRLREIVAKHTPAPWREFHDSESHDIIGPDGLHIARMEPRNSGTPQADQDADARLIAAAPEMFAALKKCEEYLVERNIERRGTVGRTQVLPMIRAAITRAKGEA